MDSMLDAQLQPLRIESLGRLAGFLALYPLLFVSCDALLLVLGILVVPVCLAWFIYDAAQEELDFFSFPMVLQSVAEDFAVLVGLKQESIIIIIDPTSSGDNDYPHVSPGTKLVHPHRQSFIPDFNKSEGVDSNHGSPRERYHISLAGTNATVSKTVTNIAHRAEAYSILSVGIPRNSPLSSNHSCSPSPSYRSAASILSIGGFLRTPEQKLFDLSWRNISPHWSVGKPMATSDTPSSLELSPGELEYLNEYIPSPKRWPSPVSDTGCLTTREDSLRIRLQKENLSENIEATERMFIGDGIGNTHTFGVDGQSQTCTNDVHHINHQSEDYFPSVSPKLERKLFAASPRDKILFDVETSLTPGDSVYQKTYNIPPAEYSNESALTTGWSHKYKDLIAEMKLKGSLGKQESDDDQPKTENFKPITDIDPHWMDTPRLEPLERPHLNKLQRWGLVHRVPRANLVAQDIEEIGRQAMTPTPNEFPSLQVSPLTSREDYNFGNLEISPEKREGQSDSGDDEYSKYWEDFDEAYNICDSKSPEPKGDEEEKWKLSMGKWAEKGVEVMKPVNEEDGSVVLSPGLKRAVRWVDHISSSSCLIKSDCLLCTKPSPTSQSSDREPLLLHDSPTPENENINGCYHLTYAEDFEPRTPSPLLPLSALGELSDLLEDSKKDSIPLEEASNRLFGRRIARAPRLPFNSSPTLTSPPRPLPVKLIRMFEDLSRPVLISPRSSSINFSPERNYLSPDRNEGYRSNEVKGLGPGIRDGSQTTTVGEARKLPSTDSKERNDGLNECF